MELILVYLSWIALNYQMLISLAVGLFSAVIAISLVIPGDQPEKFLQALVDFLSKFSKK
jgi:hypothetical protein